MMIKMTMLQQLIEQLIINRPDDPVAFLIDLLNRDTLDGMCVCVCVCVCACMRACMCVCVCLYMCSVCLLQSVSV